MRCTLVADLAQKLEGHLTEVDQRVARATVGKCTVWDIAVEKLPFVAGGNLAMRLHPEAAFSIIPNPDNIRRPEVVFVDMQRGQVILIDLNRRETEVRHVLCRKCNKRCAQIWTAPCKGGGDDAVGAAADHPDTHTGDDLFVTELDISTGGIDCTHNPATHFSRKHNLQVCQLLQLQRTRNRDRLERCGHGPVIDLCDRDSS